MISRRTSLAGAAVALSSVVLSCAAPFSSDGTSVSIGSHADGALRGGASLPANGEGYVVPSPWRARRSNFGTDELVGLLVRAARSVGRRLPDGTAAIGDLSRRGGGASIEHRSHQSGRDVDVFYYALEASGRSVMPGDVMLRYDASGRAVRWSPPKGARPPARAVPAHRLDVQRNWAFVRALLTDADAEVQWIFVQRDLAARLLREAAAVGEDPALIARAAFVLRQPSDSEPHDDHMHVRIYCDPSDRSLGCADRGPVRWWKKQWKYMEPPFGRGPAHRSSTLDALLRATRGEWPSLLFRPRLTS